MLPNGICRVTDTLYSKTIQYKDINYQLSSNEDKQEIFDSWCDFVNYFDSSVGFQFSFCDLPAAGKLLGYVLVSGLPHECDHQLIADSLAEYLGVSIGSII